MTISEEAVKAMPERIYAVKQTEGSNCVVSFDTPSLDYNVEYVRADLVPFLSVQGAVKKLEDVLRELITDQSEGEWDESTIEKDVRTFSARILSALEPSAAREIALEEAARALEAWGDIYGDNAAKCVRALASHPVADNTQCERCQGNGEIVTDWERYKHPHENDVGDEAVAECPDCNGYGYAEAIAHPVADKPDEAGAQGIERGKFYHHQWPTEKLLEARRDGLVDHSGGEAWRYEYSHKDEHGKYDILYRHVKNTTIPARLPSAPSGGDRHGE